MRRAHRFLVASSAIALGACGASSRNAPTPPCDLDPQLGAEDCTSLHHTALPSALPAAIGNAKADDEGAAKLGFLVFYDARFSSNGGVRCATCHAPETHFVDLKPVSTGLATITRNSPTVLNASRMTIYFWDGRADTLWSQPLFAFENIKEMGSSRLAIAHRTARSYADRYAPVFGALPPLDDLERFPESGKPGDPAWEAMAPDDREAINRVVANLGKSLEAYMRKVSSGPSAWDRFVGGDPSALTVRQKRGLSTFVRARCLDCHSGPMFSDMSFHDLGVPDEAGVIDRGRADGIAIEEANVFNARGPYSDPPVVAPPIAAPTDHDLGAFRTPSLRNVSDTAPYGHNGRFATLEDVIAFHVHGGGHAGNVEGVIDSKLVARDDVTDADVADIADFLKALVGAYPPHPWNDWPQK